MQNPARVMYTSLLTKGPFCPQQRVEDLPRTSVGVEQVLPFPPVISNQLLCHALQSKGPSLTHLSPGGLLLVNTRAGKGRLDFFKRTWTSHLPCPWKLSSYSAPGKGELVNKCLNSWVRAKSQVGGCWSLCKCSCPMLRKGQLCPLEETLTENFPRAAAGPGSEERSWLRS